MSETPGTGLPGTELPGTPTTLFRHALRLHRLTPDGPLPRNGEPIPDAEPRRCRDRQDRPLDHTRTDVDAAELLDRYFDAPRASPYALAVRLREVPTPFRYNQHIADAVLRAPAARARETGRWLVRHGTDLGSVAIGLAMLAEVATVDDIPRIQTIGLLSNAFGPLAARALDRLPGGVDALLWLAERVTAWGRVHVVDTLCRHVDDHPAVLPWLLRRAVDGDFLNSYFADEVARVTRLHEVIAESGDDADVVDHTGRILHVMTYCEGMGTSLRLYPHALALLEAHVRHLGPLGPTAERYFAAATVAQYLTKEVPAWTDDATVKARWDEARTSYLALVDRGDWCSTAREGLAAGDRRLTWLAEHGAPDLDLRALRT
ncbi:hypothetical protein DEJ50_08620 [Streptomyces venezuelae]|uniref:Uncharacterized protein n=1 Tax=Streptomyces venezuelae TaxID=54571 RepID=A0A5P2CYB9_STRVZ|nr:hypothetical protein [Streptomyces venezuelae]QES47865.1 hypothetical protein DEJ50_08620 [Streptomyces venezuelae]